MWPKIVRFFTDEQTFTEMFGRGTNWLRGLIAFVALGIGSGIGPFAPVTQALGEAGWIGTGVLIFIAFVIRSGDRTPPTAKALEYADPERLRAMLQQLGVPMSVADKAAEKTAETPPPKV